MEKTHVVCMAISCIFSWAEVARLTAEFEFCEWRGECRRRDECCRSHVTHKYTCEISDRYQNYTYFFDITRCDCVNKQGRSKENKETKNATFGTNPKTENGYTVLIFRGNAPTYSLFTKIVGLNTILFFGIN